MTNSMVQLTQITKSCLAFLVTFFTLSSFGVTDLSAQVVRVQNGIQVRQMFIGRQPDQVDGAIDVDKGAILKTDPDLEASLATAERFKNDGNYRVASQLYQAVLLRSGDALYSSDDKIYFSLVRQIEQILAELPPEGLAAYRVMADAQAKEILAAATGPQDTLALNQVVRLYFISSLGDDAAFQLGCIYLDQFDFAGARRMFEKILNHYPDSSIPRDQVLLRVALCQSYLGQLSAAKESLAAAEELTGQTVAWKQLSSSLGTLSSPVTSSSSSGWSMLLGNSGRDGVMPAPPANIMDSDLIADWQFYFEPSDQYANWSQAEGDVVVGDKSRGDQAARTVKTSEEKIIERWIERDWRPAGQLLFDNGMVYFKSAADMTAWKIDRIGSVAKVAEEKLTLNDFVAWRSVWRNSFAVDQSTQLIQVIRRSWGGYGNRNQESASTSPESTSEVQLFGDTIHQQISIVDGVLYSIEGKPFDDRNRNREENVQPQWNVSIPRSRSNFLTAYDAATGQVQFTLPRVPVDAASEKSVEPVASASPWLEGGGFMAAPIGFGDLIIAPINVGGSISVYAFDPADSGRTVWKSFLCDEPEAGAEAWSAINLTIDGSDLFVNTGIGVVFVLDPSTGLVRFARRYTRTGAPDDGYRRGGWSVNRLDFNGWASDSIMSYGRQLIRLSSDSNVIEAMDRNTGEMIWKTDMSPLGFKVDYLLGVHQDILYAAGRETIIAYDLAGEGRMIWGGEQMFDDKKSLGRGLLTSEGIYMPVKNSIYHFDLPQIINSDSQTKENEEMLAFSHRPTARVEVDFGTGAPVGNLYSDGKRLWVHGGSRLYALSPKE